MKNPYSPAEFPAIIAQVMGGNAPANIEARGLPTGVPTRIVPISGEQTNFSFIVDDETIWKFYADLPDGEGQEVRIGHALRAFVPPFVGHLSLGGRTLCVVTRFLPGAKDLWELRGAPLLSSLTPALGSSLGSIHAQLVDAFGSHTTTGADLRARLNERLRGFRARTNLLEPFAADALSAYEAVGSLGAIATQAIHGDLHLGQILLSGDHLYYLDFEGEPGATDSPVDSPLRDVAGLIRSFHYAGLDFDLSAFSPAYEEASGMPLDADLLRANLIDRFCYEVVYELDHRPEWVNVPLDSARFVF